MKTNINSLTEVVKELLNKDNYTIVDSTNENKQVLNKTKITSLAREFDKDLLLLLFGNEKTKKHFFTTLEDGIVVFKLQNFLNFINNREFLPDSYTAYRNRIGLALGSGTGADYLANRSEVVLNFPYKDCILEGGQTKEDSKRQEVFYNEVLASDQINRLLDDKVFTNFKKYEKDGDKVKSTDNPTNLDFDKENLIIKGNNLVVLHSLKRRFAGKVKLIYIDPPYNTGNDSFGYNDRFNHSTWLVFMKNRLEVAKELLSDDGSIYVNIDYNEVHYLKIIMDEVFGRENFITQIIWRMGFLSGYKTAAKKYIRNYDVILFYSKSNNYCFNKNYIQNSDFAPLLTKNEIKNAFKECSFDEGLIDKFDEFVNYKNRGERYPLEDTWNCNKWDKLNSIAIDSSVSRVVETTEINGENFKGQKPEKLIQRIIECSTNKSDLVLDYHLGSGTTAAVAHKMGRQYIGIEQMNYIEDVTIERLKNVVAGEQGGISKAVNWQGGGSFVTCELANEAEAFRAAVVGAKDFSPLQELCKIKNSSFLAYRIDREKLDETEFATLSIEEQKR